MFRAIGTVIVLVALSKLLAGAFQAFEFAAIAGFETFEAAALTATEQFEARR